MNAIYIIRKHPPYPFGRGHLEVFTIVDAKATKKEADEITKQKNSKASRYLYTVGRVQLKETK